MINIKRMVGVLAIAFIGAFASVFADGIRTSDIKDISELGTVLIMFGTKALSAAVSASITAVMAYLTMPFSGVQANALKVGKE